MKKKLLLAILIIAYSLPGSALAAKMPKSNAIDATLEDVTGSNCTFLGNDPAPDENGKLEIPDANANLPLLIVTTTAEDGSNVKFLYYSCSPEQLAIVQTGNGALPWHERTIIDIVSAILKLVNAVVGWARDFLGKMIVTIIAQGLFINNNIVKDAWPFIQGIANLGFIFVLLYIALATTLRMESVGTSVQRLLPKLLIGALLVNFSLVIGGVLIDASRLIMAVEIRLMGGEGVTNENFTSKLIQKTDALDLQIAALDNANNKNDFSTVILRLVQNTVFVVLLTVALGVITINLFVRYIALLILLIFSPVPYLAFILPQTQKFADDWWRMFLKWVFYGPIVFFFLILITRIQSVGLALPQAAAKNAFDAPFFNAFAHFAIIIALFFVANKVGKQVAGVGSDAVMSFAAKNKRTAAAVGLGVATGGLGVPLLAGAGYLAGRAGVRGVANVGRDFGDKFKKDVTASARGGKFGGIAKFIAGPERDDKGKLKKGETSPGLSAAKAIGKRFGLGDPKKQLQTDEIKRELASTPLSTPAMASTAIPTNLQQYINGAGLSQGHIAKALDDGTKPLDTSSTLRFIIEHNDNKGTVGGLAQNEDFLRDLGSDGRNEFIKILNTNTRLSANDKADIVNRMVRTVKDKEI